MADKKKGQDDLKSFKCSVCGGQRRAIYPSGRPSGSDTYLWCDICDGSTIDVPKDFLDKKRG
jgi:hypothetical protein